MIVALVAACACAILFVILPGSWDRAARFIGTSALIAAACAAALPALPRSDAHAMRIAEWSWLGLILVEVALIEGMIWTDGHFFGYDEQAIASIFFLAGTYALAFVPLRHLGKTPDALTRPARLAVGAFTGSTAVILAIWFSDGLGSRAYILIPTWWTLVGWTILCAACAAGLAEPRSLMRRAIAVVGIASSTTAAAITIAVMHSSISETPTVLLAIGGFTAGIAGSCAVLALIDVLDLSLMNRRLALALAACALCTGALAGCVAVLDSQYTRPEWAQRFFTAFLIADGCLGLTLIILHRIGRRATTHDWQIRGADILCPRCGKRSHFATGIHPCSHCAFQVLLAFRDDCCARCRHDLRALPEGSPCPECGTRPERSAADYLGAAGTAGATSGEASLSA